MTNTPNRSEELAPSRNFVRRSSGFQIALPKMTLDDEETIMPIKEVRANPIGIVKSWDHSALLGLFAKREKSGSLTISVAKLAMEDMMPFTTAHANSLPCTVLG